MTPLGPVLFASGLGAIQEVIFDDSGTILYVSSRERKQIVQSQAVREVWLRNRGT